MALLILFFSFLCRDAGSGVQASVLRLRDKGTDNRDAGGVTGERIVIRMYSS